jgi:phosphoadenosine phosphosulfate reductase
LSAISSEHTEVNEQLAGELLREISSLTPVEGMRLLSESFRGQSVFSTSFGMEDQVITDMIAGEGISVSIFTLDTGRMFPETYAVWSATMEKYRLPIVAYVPDSALLGAFVTAHGPNGFYESVDLRKACCHARKVVPLRQALAGQRLWITGIRGGQSAGRDRMDMIEWDEANGIIKYHPLLTWSVGEVREYIATNNVPYNVLHDRGFPSIGCAPCTRAVKEGEDLRSGRWWWEENDKKECGLHAHVKS